MGADREAGASRQRDEISRSSRNSVGLQGRNGEKLPQIAGACVSTEKKTAGPLDGVRVLDLTTMIAGPVATMMLADQGADVIKVEAPSGDLMRRLARGRNGMNPAFLSANRNKRSIAVDLKQPAGRAILHKLIATADVLAHNFRPGAPERLGVTESDVRAIRPDIVYVSISGFGEVGPYAGQRAYDPVIQAVSGLADVQR